MLFVFDVVGDFDYVLFFNQCWRGKKGIFFLISWFEFDSQHWYLAAIFMVFLVGSEPNSWPCVLK